MGALIAKTINVKSLIELIYQRKTFSFKRAYRPIPPRTQRYAQSYNQPPRWESKLS